MIRDRIALEKECWACCTIVWALRTLLGRTYVPDQEQKRTARVLKRIDGLLTRLRLGKCRHLLRATSTWVVQLLETNRGNWACIDTYRTLSKMLFSVILVRIPVNMTLYAPHVRNLLSEPGSLCCSTQRTLWRSIRLSEMMNALLRANQLKGIYMELASSWHTSVRGKMESPKQSSYVPRSVEDH